MKKILLFLLLLSATSAFAQDVIVKKDGSTILSKVLKITANEVEYKKYSNQNGPTYTIAKAEIMSINYSNGDKETFDVTEPVEAQQPVQQQQLAQPQQLSVGTSGMAAQKVSDSDLLKMVTKVKKPREPMPKNKKLMIAGLTVGGALILTGVGFACAIATDNADAEDKEDMKIIMAVGFVSGAAIMAPCLFRAHKLKRQSSLTVHSSPLYHHDLALRNGASLSTGIDLMKDNRLNSHTLGLGIRYNF